LGVNLVELKDVFNYEMGPFLYSFQLEKGIENNNNLIEKVGRYLINNNIEYDVFLHKFDDLPVEKLLVNCANNVFCGNEEIAYQVKSIHKNVITLFCPSLLSGESIHFDDKLNIFSFGMAHKIQLKYYQALNQILSENGIDYVLRISTAFHEKVHFGDLNIISDKLGKMYRGKIQFLGFLSDDSVNYFLEKSDLFTAFFDSAFRAGNTSVYAAMMKGCSVLTNVDKYSPTWLKHNENFLDISKVKFENLNKKKLKSIGQSSRQYVEKNVNWNQLVNILSNEKGEN